MKQKPKLGQNFLIDPAACAAIVDALGDVSNQTVVEIGPGAGAITQTLAQRASRLIAVELDSTLAARLREQFPSVEVLQADILNIDLSSLRAGGEKLRVVGNLPYYITSPILQHICRHSDAIALAVLMMQREVANRVSAAPGSRDYGLLSAAVQLYSRVERILDLPPHAFMPPPEVHSTVLRLTMHRRFSELGIAPETFLSFLKQCFAQKRKTIAKNLRAAGFSPNHITPALAQTGVASTARAEELDLRHMAELWKALRRD